MFKTILNLSLLALLCALLITSCSKSKEAEEVSAVETATVQKVALAVKGMTCLGCEFNVESAIKKVAGVTNVEADFASHSAAVTYDPEQANIENFIEALNAIGYEGSTSNLN